MDQNTTVPWRNIVQLDGTRNYLRCQRHNLGGPQSRPEVSRLVQFVIPTSAPYIQKKSLGEKGVNIQIGLFSSQDENLVTNSIYKKHTNRYLTATIHSRLKRRGELPSSRGRCFCQGADRYVNS